MGMSRVLLICGLLAAVAAFGSSDDRFLKKYAMMKIYESCFGADVVKEIRREMKEACAKCAAPAEEEMQTSQQENQPQQMNPMSVAPPFVQVMQNNLPVYTRLGEPNPDPNQNNDIPQQQMAALAPQPLNGPPESQLDFEKLQQAILSYSRIPQPVPNYQVPNFGFRSPFGPSPYQQPFIQPWGPQPFAAQYPQPIYQQPYQFYGNRISRDMDFKNKLELLTSRTSGKVRNVTCVMQELGYLDQNLEPNYEKISERIANLPIPNDLKSDMQDGLQFCQQFAKCVPDSKKENSPLSRELIKPMFFFKCYKHKKLEACIMKDVRDKFASDEEFDTDSEFRSSRAGRAMKHNGESKQQSTEVSEDMAGVFYDFFYGSNDEQDSFF